MFNIGFGELAVICIVLIIVVGPERLPSMMKTLGKTLRTLRQASRDIRASTGIDELMREDFDLYAPVKPSVPKPPPVSIPAEAALPAAALQTEAASATAASAQDGAEPKPISREEALDADAPADRPSVVVAPPPQAVGRPSPDAVSDSAASSADLSLPSESPAAEHTAPLADATGTILGLATPAAASGDTLPRAPVQAVPPKQPEQSTQPAVDAAAQVAQAAPSATVSGPTPGEHDSMAAGAARAASETKQSGA
jgi:sec-independent protein translocase protein TatB